ncbi:MAG: hypothetical protein IKX24_07920 [Prevotella sp.]|nr:hypothetical protein [Prevotella sp.]
MAGENDREECVPLGTRYMELLPTQGQASSTICQHQPFRNTYQHCCMAGYLV